ncbi:MAG TPA: hypothetical protein VIN08_20405 [Ohtaekwangia sp.]|uniref:hypothetical protein n=1 Tax=Ohtaekwangia sp. TaxID=2066019 RepID=UPI002F94B882
MNTPKPPFHTTTEELLYSILQKLPDMTYLTANDINSIAKVNALILDGDLLTDESIANALDTIRGKVPEEGNTLGKLYSIIQGLGNLKKEDIDTLAELNAILNDADVLSLDEFNESMTGLMDGVPVEGNSLRKLFDLIATKQNRFGSTFPDTYFVSPNGNDQTGLKGDFSKSYSPAGAAALAQPGDRIAFLPGNYIINTNIAKPGVAYTTFGGKATITVNQQDTIVFDFVSLTDNTKDVIITGDFDFIIQNGGGVFSFKGSEQQKFTVRWANAFQSEGVFMRMPGPFSSGIFEGNIEMDETGTQAAIECPTTISTEGAGVMNLRINNRSHANYAIKPWFGGFIFNITYKATHYGLFSPPLNAGGNDHNVYILNVNQGDSCVTHLTYGICTGSFNGGAVTVYPGNFNMDARITNCTLNAAPMSSAKITAQANNVKIVNDQVNVLKLDGVWKDCSYMHTSTSLCILEGQFYNFQFINSVGILKITGYVRLKDTTSAPIYGNEYLEITGKLVGNAQQVILLGQGAPIVISGMIKQLSELSPVIKSSSGGHTHLLALRGCVLEAGTSAPGAIEVNLPDAVNMKLYGKSYSNKPMTGTASVNYLVGSADDLLVDTDVNVVDL